MHLSRRNIIAAVLGAFYGKELSAAELAGRICKVDVNRDLPILTAWDLGVDDPTAIWVFQVEPGRVNAIDYYESSGHGLSHYVDWLNENNYRGVDWVPHDARVREFGSGRTRIEAMLKLGRKPRLVPAHSVMDGINAARQTIPCTYFDATRCAKGLEALREYKAEFDDDLRTFKKVPKHDWPRTLQTPFAISQWRGVSRCKPKMRSLTPLPRCLNQKPWIRPGRNTRRNRSTRAQTLTSLNLQL
jgi:hypothetical protein